MLIGRLRLARLLLALTASIAARTAFAVERPVLELAPIYTDHMVLQRDRPIPMSGTASPGAEVSVVLEGRASALARADASGHWALVLPAMTPTAGVRLTASSGTETVVLVNVAVGDVFLCSGQSNMEFPLRLATDADNAIANSARDTLRLLKVPRQASAVPVAEFASATSWRVSAPETVREFSAACYFMGVELQRSRDVTIGLIDASWGGSFIEAWLDPTTLAATGWYQSELESLSLWHSSPDIAEQQWQLQMDAYLRSGYPATGEGLPADASRVWEEWHTDLADFDGFAIYSTQIELTADQARMAQTLLLGTIDDIDTTFVNGRRVGQTDGWNRQRRYSLPSGVLRPGRNSIEIRVLDTGGGGGLHGPGPRAILLESGEQLPLEEWMLRQGRTIAEVGDIPRRSWIPTSGPGMLANGMIAPLGRIPLAGIAWYQGESNASDPDGYARLLPLLLRQWRETFATRRFAIVQLANFSSHTAEPQESDWAELREVQRRLVAGDPDAGLAITIDVGDPYDIHPANKRTVGLRLAAAMDGSGKADLPLVHRSNNQPGVILLFDHDLMQVAGRSLIGFEACSYGNCRFVDGSLVDSRRVEIPVESGDNLIRFLWSNSPITNLYDDQGMPVTPFEISIPQLP